MKRILVACDRVRMDGPLRRSLAHLVKSCDINVVHDGYAAFDEISAQPFDLIVVDFAIVGIDSLELTESLQYIDPGVPVIMLLQESHKSIKSVVRASPIVCPFKPLKFLRLVDKLLHQQLNRYRQLASALELALDTLRQQTNTASVFLVEENGQVLLTRSDLDISLVETLGSVAVGLNVLDKEMERLFNQDSALHNHYQEAQKDHGLYVIPVTANLRLAILAPLTIESPETNPLWMWLDIAAINIRKAFDRYSHGAAVSDDDLSSDKYNVTPQEHIFIPLSLKSQIEAAPTPATAIEIKEDTEDDEEIAVNWQIISSSSNLLARLQSLSRNG